MRPSATGAAPPPILRRVALLMGLAVGAGATPGLSQLVPPPAPGSGTVTVAPGAGYEAGGLHRVLFGGGHRDLWTTPIEVPVVDLGALGGGLTPLRIGGGTTTRTLHLRGADGRRFVFRSVEKAPVEFEVFNQSILAELVQDQVSSFHPTGAPVVARLLDAVGVLHTDPAYMVVPDDPRLGEFREDFAGWLVLVEERPSDGPDGAPGFAGSRRIVSTEELFEALEENPDHRVDAAELLRARLIDLLVGDRDRSHNNHLWASFDTGGGTVWRVIPRDRDQAFVRFDGLFKAVARAWEGRLVIFEDRYPDIFDLTRNAWDIDRRLLVGLDRQSWQEIVREVQSALTDEVIADAVAGMPPEHVALVGPELTGALLQRRRHLPEAAERLYDVVFRFAEVHGTDAPESLVVTRSPEGWVDVELQADPGNRGYHRRFLPTETAEVRVYLRGGADTTLLRGSGARDITVRVVGGGGRDVFGDESRGPAGSTVLYDGGDETSFPARGSADVVRASPSPSLSWWEERRERDWGSQTIPQPAVSYDDDRGLVVSPGIDYRHYDFGKQPFGTRVQLKVGWSLGLSEPVVDLRYLRRRLLSGSDLRLHVRWSGIEIINFYGFGNETITDRSKNFHRVSHEQVSATLAAVLGDVERAFVEIGPSFRYASTDTTSDASFIAQEDPYGAGRFARAGVRMAVGFDRRDHQGRPTRGTRMEGEVGAYPKLLDVESGYQEARGQLMGYVSPWGDRPVLALRTAAEKVWGPVPFASAAFLGGPTTVRSLRFQRYAGDALLLGSAELRMPFWRIYFPMPLDIGVYGLADVGRVWAPGESSDVWHGAVGGGIFFGLIDRSEVVRVAVARGGGRTALMAGLGFIY